MLKRILFYINFTVFGLATLLNVVLFVPTLAEPVLNEPAALTPLPSAQLKGTEEAWNRRAQTWYRSHEKKEQRKQMREMSRPLKRACYYCHTRNFKAYVPERYMLSLQMMAISAEQGLSCADCHQGQRGLSTLGAKSLLQWRYSIEKQKDCSDCHQANGQFRVLTAEGEQAREEIMKDVPRLAKKLNINSQVTELFMKQLKKKSSVESKQEQQIIVEEESIESSP